MVAVFRNATAEVSKEYEATFPVHLRFEAVLDKICYDAKAKLLKINEDFFVEGDLVKLLRVQDMLVHVQSVFGSLNSQTSPVECPTQMAIPFSALVEAAEAISRGVEVTNKDETNCLWNREHDYVSQVSKVPSSSTSEVSSKVPCSTSEVSSKVPTSTSEVSSKVPSSARDVTISNCDVDKKSSEQEQFDDQCEMLEEYSDDTRQDLCNIDQNLTVNQEPIRMAKSETSNSPLKSEFCLLKDITIQKHVEKELEIANLFSEKEATAKSFLLNRKLSKRKVSELQDGYEDEGLVHCDTCGKVFVNMRYLKSHELTHDPANRTCEICGKVYMFPKTLQAHMKTHGEDYVKKVYKCDQIDCSRSFTSKYNLDAHQKSEHFGSRETFLCQLCGKKFTTKNTMLQHMNIHLGLRPFSCKSCGKSFTHESVLRDHQLSHTNTKLFICNYPDCAKTFTHRSSLKTHKAIHKDTKDFVCDQCGKGFTQKQALIRHERAHKGVKPFKCRICGRLFGDPSVVRRHLQLIHKVFKDVESWREDIEEIKVLDSETSQESTATIPETNNDGLDKQLTNEAQLLSTKNLEERSLKTISDSQYMQFVDYGTVIANEANATHSLLSFEGLQNLDGTQIALPAQHEQGSKTRVQSVLNFPELQAMLQTSQSHMEPRFIKRTVLRKQAISALKTNEDIFAIPVIVASQFQSNLDQDKNVQLFTENIDGTFSIISEPNTYRKSSNDCLIGGNTGMDVALNADFIVDQLKPDGTFAENDAIRELQDSKEADINSDSFHQLYAFNSQFTDISKC
ncbi:zinc finger protein 624-like [Dreissena polymorpha]|uniref:C2H2-type domain-containing protein n=1 Tax=Dreissena polymorpha TaxID=45954 RepID=A0A9D4QNA6_DREPO|nr:zinc finger protein 624-like [Dreissena polymorpha]KAH3836355.1 hypothetical protein DPMN_109725 [Dreissena polymorpha]